MTDSIFEKIIKREIPADIVFEDDVKDFKKLNSENKKKCSYCSLTDK